MGFTLSLSLPKSTSERGTGRRLAARIAKGRGRTRRVVSAWPPCVAGALGRGEEGSNERHLAYVCCKTRAVKGLARTADQGDAAKNKAHPSRRFNSARDACKFVCLSQKSYVFVAGVRRRFRAAGRKSESALAVLDARSVSPEKSAHKGLDCWLLEAINATMSTRAVV